CAPPGGIRPWPRHPFATTRVIARASPSAPSHGLDCSRRPSCTNGHLGSRGSASLHGGHVESCPLVSRAGCRILGTRVPQGRWFSRWSPLSLPHPHFPAPCRAAWLTHPRTPRPPRGAEARRGRHARNGRPSAPL